MANATVLEAKGQVNGGETDNLTKAGSKTSSGPSAKRDPEGLTADALRQVRASLGEAGCVDAPEGFRRKAFQHALEIANELAKVDVTATYGAYYDDEEKELELVVDSLDMKKRVCLQFRDCGCRIVEASAAHFSATAWRQRPYSLLPQAEWLAGL
jgi:hypothetical protein